MSSAARISRIMKLVEQLWQDHPDTPFCVLMNSIFEYSRKEHFSNIKDDEVEAFLSLYRNGGWISIQMACNEAEEEAKIKAQAKNTEKNTARPDPIQGFDWGRAEVRIVEAELQAEARLQRARNEPNIDWQELMIPNDEELSVITDVEDDAEPTLDIEGGFAGGTIMFSNSNDQPDDVDPAADSNDNVNYTRFFYASDQPMQGTST